jgi:hypothetical protein
MRRLGSVLVLAVLAAGVSGCRKSAVAIPLIWHIGVADGEASAAREHKPVAMFFGASWDTAWKEIEVVTLADPEVRGRLAHDFVAVYVDATDDEAPATREASRRFKVVGDPTILLLTPDLETELARFTEFIPPRRMSAALRAATQWDAASDARQRAREKAEAREREERAWMLEAQKEAALYRAREAENAAPGPTP